MRTTLGLSLVMAAALGCVPPARADTVSRWMGELGLANGIELQTTHELVLSTHIDGRLTLAMFEAANAVDHRYKSFLGVAPVAEPTSADAAIDTAAHDVLDASFPNQAPRLDETYEDLLVETPDDATRVRGVALGHRIAQMALQAAGVDPGRTVPAYRPVAQVGVWVPTGLPTLPTTYLALKPWFLSRIEEMRPGGPPALTSSTYVDAFNETKAIGGKNSVTRTPAQTEAATFWQAADEMAVLHQITDSPGRTLVQNARLWALVTLAHDDENTVLTDAKAYYAAWRPITAIRNADRDPSPLTERDPAWEPALPTPTHAEYPCGHCMHIAMLMTLLEAEPGLDASQPLVFTAQHMPGVAYRLSPEEAVTNCSMARIWGGMHFRFSVEAGQQLGRKLARYVLTRFGTPA